MIKLTEILSEVKNEALTPMQKLARKRAMAGKQRLIQRKKQRTALRKKDMISYIRKRTKQLIEMFMNSSEIDYFLMFPKRNYPLFKSNLLKSG